MPRPRPSVTKRQREQKKRDRQNEKLERRALRKSGAGEKQDPETLETVEEDSETIEQPA